jgi:hypothetical protein
LPLEYNYTVEVGSYLDPRRMENGMPNQRFVIFAHTRTGSYNLVSLLDSHPQIDCHGELLQPVGPPFSRHTSIIGQMEDRYHSFEYRRLHYEGFLEHVFKRSDCIVGFKLIAIQHMPAMVYCIMEPTIKVIYVYRDNLLAAYSSEQIAKKTGQNMVKTDDTVKRVKVVFDAKEFETRRQARESRHELYMELLKRSGSDYLTLEYNELVLRKTQNDILTFLSASRVDLNTSYRKRNTNDIVARYSNPDEVRSHLLEIGRPNWAMEGD